MSSTRRSPALNNVRVAISCSSADVDSFVHKDFPPPHRQPSKYANPAGPIETSSSPLKGYNELVETIRLRRSHTVGGTSIDEESARSLHAEFDLPIIKIASADSNDWQLIEKIARTESRHRFVRRHAAQGHGRHGHLLEKRDIDLAIIIA